MPELSYDETLQRLGVAPEAAAGPSISALAPGTEEAAIRVGERIEELRRSLESLPAELRAQVEKACADADEKLLHAVSFGVSQEDMEESRFAAQLLVDYADVLRQAAIDPVAAVVPAIDYERLTSEFGNEHGPSPAPPILSDILQRLPGLLSTGRLRRTLDGAAAQAGFAPSLYEALLDAPETAAAWLGQRDGEPPFSDRPTLANALSVAVDSNAGMTKFVELISTTSLRDDEPAKSAVVKKLQQLPTLLRRRPDATQIAAILNWLGKQSVPWQQLLSGELENKEFAKLTALLQSCPEADVHAFLDAGVGTSGAARSIVDQVSSELSNPDRKRDPEFVALVEQLKTKDKDLLTWDEIQASDVVAAARDFPSDEQLMFYGFEARRAPFVVAAQAVRLAKQDAAKALEFQGKKEAARR
ncbi:MAG TPA: hypothetical protein VGE52_16690, partial [Pirellulales bacterium]